MAVITINSQYKYTGKGPFDAKSIVRTYSDLIKKENWQIVEGSKTIPLAYNGMLVAVWADKQDALNGIYYLQDKTVTSILQTPDVTKSENWIKLGDSSEALALKNQLSDINTTLATVSNKATENDIAITAVSEDLENISEQLIVLDNKIKDIKPSVDIAQLEKTFAKLEEVNTKKEAALIYVAKDNLATELNALVQLKSNDTDTPVESFADIVVKVITSEQDLKNISEDLAAVNGKLVGIDGTIKEYLDSRTSETVLPAFSEEFKISETGRIGLDKINIRKLIQDENDILVINGGITAW